MPIDSYFVNARLKSTILYIIARIACRVEYTGGPAQFSVIVSQPFVAVIRLWSSIPPTLDKEEFSLRSLFNNAYNV